MGETMEQRTYVPLQWIPCVLIIFTIYRSFRLTRNNEFKSKKFEAHEVDVAVLGK